VSLGHSALKAHRSTLVEPSRILCLHEARAAADRPVHPVRRLRPPRRGGPAVTAAGPISSRRRDGRPLRAEPHHRPARRREGREATTLPLDVHLMIVEPRLLATSRRPAPTCSAYTPRRVRTCTARSSRSRSWARRRSSPQPGHAIARSTTSGDLDMVLIMSVNPGYGGQQLIPAVLPKIAALRGRLAEAGLTVDVEIDAASRSTTSPSRPTRARTSSSVAPASSTPAVTTPPPSRRCARAAPRRWRSKSPEQLVILTSSAVATLKKRRDRGRRLRALDLRQQRYRELRAARHLLQRETRFLRSSLMLRPMVLVQLVSRRSTRPFFFAIRPSTWRNSSMRKAS